MGSTALLLVKLFAPNAEQMYLVNHLKDSPAEEKRNVLEENARRAHGDIQDLADLNSSKPEAVIIPSMLEQQISCPRMELKKLKGKRGPHRRNEGGD
ncbi:glyoxalase ElbB-like isoform X3 [Mirounga angustirostris]|uniref:glyoxalase ElbB-like isoform X3 n=1 Tax=Mirounga angustirostris TaxID=9716 RepID=UPI00313D7F75